jgi:hypothetical protein
VGADRKGPLAAFVVIAIIAAVLLVTTVRSQAAPGWLDPADLPPSVVAAPPATDPHLWAAVGSGVHQVVHDGVVLAKDAATDDSVNDGADASLVAAASRDTPTGDDGHSTDGGTRPDGQHTTDHAQGPPATGHHARHHDGGNDGDHVGDQPSEPAGLASGGHGQHHGHGHGHGHGHSHGHGHGHGFRHGRPHGDRLAG